ncbi:MAG: hypothetical protein AAF845_00945 [Bacteroidota bacterium]
MDLLSDYPAPIWTDWFVEAERLRARGDMMRAARKVLGAFGGMGSINDSYQMLSAPPEVHEEMDVLLDRLWCEAREVRSLWNRLVRFVRVSSS